LIGLVAVLLGALAARFWSVRPWGIAMVTLAITLLLGSYLAVRDDLVRIVTRTTVRDRERDQDAVLSIPGPIDRVHGLVVMGAREADAGHAEQAKKTFREALRTAALSPMQEEWLMSEVVEAQVRAGLYDEAEATLANFRKKKTADDAWVLGNDYLRAGAFERAAAKAEAMSPTYQFAFLQSLAVAEAKANRREMARATIDKLYRLAEAAPESGRPDRYNRIADTLISCDYHEEALGVLLHHAPEFLPSQARRAEEDGRPYLAGLMRELAADAGVVTDQYKAPLGHRTDVVDEAAKSR
jgi:hypothetical protein